MVARLCHDKAPLRVCPAEKLGALSAQHVRRASMDNNGGGQ